MTSLLILIAGPYRSGTRNNPARIAANLARLEEVSWPLFRAGHVPMVSEWVALPVIRSAGAVAPEDDLAEQVLYPTAQRLLARCDGVLRIGGPSVGADRMAATARALGKTVWCGVDEVPAS
jgi:hypothetical protein